MFAPALPYNESHRHFSNAMAIYPLGLIRWEDGPASQEIIRNTLARFDSVGPPGLVRVFVCLALVPESQGKRRQRGSPGADNICAGILQHEQLPPQRGPDEIGLFLVHIPSVHAGGKFRVRLRAPGDVAAKLCGSASRFFPQSRNAGRTFRFSTLRAEGGSLSVHGKKGESSGKFASHRRRGGQALLRNPFARWHTGAAHGARSAPERTLFISCSRREGPSRSWRGGD